MYRINTSKCNTESLRIVITPCSRYVADFKAAAQPPHDVVLEPITRFHNRVSIVSMSLWLVCLTYIL
jgi:hypothetical protein